MAESGDIILRIDRGLNLKLNGQLLEARDEFKNLLENDFDS